MHDLLQDKQRIGTCRCAWMGGVETPASEEGFLRMRT